MAINGLKFYELILQPAVAARSWGKVQIICRILKPVYGITEFFCCNNSGSLCSCNPVGHNNVKKWQSTISSDNILVETAKKSSCWPILSDCIHL